MDVRLKQDENVHRSAREWEKNREREFIKGFFGK